MNEWKLTPRSKSGFFGKHAKNNIGEMSNYFNKTKEQLEDDIIDGTDSLEIIAEKYKNINYEKLFEKTLKMSVDKRNRIYEKIFSKWYKLTFEELNKRVGSTKLIKIMSFIKMIYPDDYNNRVLKKWPELEELV